MENVIIVGAGPAGISCAVMLKHLGISSLLIEKKQPGGLLRNAYLVKNYLGFNGMGGVDLVKKFTSHLNDFKIKPLHQDVIKITHKKYFAVTTNKKKYNARFVVIAAGTKPKPFAYKMACKKNLFYEIADFPKVKNKTIAVVGAGDSAFDYALSLAKKNKAVILNRGKVIKANKFLVKQVLANKNISYLDNFKIDKIKQDAKKLILHGTKNIAADFILSATGREPVYPQVTKNVLKNKNLYLAGDIKNAMFRQSSIASADAIKCAMEIYAKLTNPSKNS